MPSSHPVESTTTTEASGPTFRSSAVARLAAMPVATLRIWEQRHRAVEPMTTASGHRLYSAADVQRVLLLRRLTQQGHAIGSIATLDSAQLLQLSRPPGLGVPRQAASGAGMGARRTGAVRLAVVGSALATRLQRPALSKQLLHLQQVAVFGSLNEAAHARLEHAVDLLLWHAPELQPGMLPALQTAQRACGARRVAVVYRYGSAAAIGALADIGATACREPADDEALVGWLASGSAWQPGQETADPWPATQTIGHPDGALAPRRYGDDALTAIAGLPPTLACECPRHVAELLMQLSSFEAYSAGCINRDADDAALHAYLQHVAGAARAMFEAALERVARHEGLPLR